MKTKFHTKTVAVLDGSTCQIGSHFLTVVGGVGAALSIGTSCRCGAVITAPVGGGATLYRILSGKRGGSLATHDTTGEKKETFNWF